MLIARGMALPDKHARWRARTDLVSWVLAACVVLSVAPATPVCAQDGPSAEDRQAAADAFDRGTRAYLARDYGTAAGWFETAYRMAPAAAALLQAVRAHERAGNVVRAATLSLRLQALYPGDRAGARQAEQTLRHAAELVRVEVACAGECTLELDGALTDHPTFFVAPGTEHRVRATFETGPVEATVTGAAGETRRLPFEAPPPPEPTITPPDPEPVRVPDAEPVVTPGQAAQGGGGLSPAVMVTGLALTAVAGGVLVWSGVDTLDGVPAYQADPTPERLADGQGRETRTNVLIGVTAGLAAVTLVLAIFTDWGGSSSGEAQAEVSAVVVPLDGGAMGAVGGRF